jgi:hypothetical protein
MPLTDTGRDAIAGMLIGESITPFNAFNARIGVGTGNTAFAAGQTDLQGGTTLRHVLEATYPQRVGNLLTFRALFSTSEANFAWEEWGIFNAEVSGLMLNRKVESLGTKTSSQSWMLTLEVTVESVP